MSQADKEKKAQHKKARRYLLSRALVKISLYQINFGFAYSISHNTVDKKIANEI